MIFSKALKLVVFSIASLASVGAMAFGVGIRPSNVETVYEPGKTYRQTLQVQNVATGGPVKLVVSTADWDFDDKNKLFLKEPGGTENSASNWITFSPSSMVLKPGEVGTIQVDINVPVKINSSMEHRTAILVSTVLPSLEERMKQKGVWNRWQIASLFYLTPAASKEQKNSSQNSKSIVAPFVSFAPSVPYFKGDKLNIDLNVKNDTTHHLRLEGEMDVQDASGKSVLKSPFTQVILAKRDIQGAGASIVVDWPEALAKGDYKVKIKIANTYSPLYPANYQETIYTGQVDLAAGAWFSKQSEKPGATKPAKPAAVDTKK